MPAGYRFLPQPNDVAQAVLAASTWAVLALICDIELFSQAHYRSSIEPRRRSTRCGRTCSCSTGRRSRSTRSSTRWSGCAKTERLDAAQRDQAVDDLIGLVGAVDGIVQMQAKADAEYFVQVAGRAFDDAQAQAIHATMLAAYRWQYIVSGVQDPRFLEVLGSMINAEQGARINAALAPIVGTLH